MLTFCVSGEEHLPGLSLLARLHTVNDDYAYIALQACCLDDGSIERDRLAFVYFCKLLDGVHSHIIVNYSNGTMAFIGLHWMLTGFIRYGILKPIFGVSSDHIYTPFEAYALGLLVTLLLYPIILFFQSKMPWMLGKRR